MKRLVKKALSAGLILLFNVACVSQKAAIRDDVAPKALEEGRALDLFREGAELLYRDNEKAEEKFSAVISSDENFKPAYFNQGLARELLGKFSQAKESYEACLAKYVKESACLENLLVVKVRLGEGKEAQALKERYLKEYPEEAFVYVSAAKLAFLENNLDESESYARSALEREAENVEALFVMARIFYAKNHYAAARWVAKNALELAPSHGGLHLLLGHTFMKLDLLHDALESYQAAVQSEPSEEALESFGLLLLKRGRVKEAVETLSKLEAMFPSVYRHHLHAANAYMADKQFEKAQSAYLRALELKPDDKDVYFNLALLYFDLKPATMSELERLKTSQSYFARYLESDGLSKERIAEVANYQQTLSEKIEVEEYAIESAKEQAASPEEPAESEDLGEEEIPRDEPEEEKIIEKEMMPEDEGEPRKPPVPEGKKDLLAPTPRSRDDEGLEEETF